MSFRRLGSIGLASVAALGVALGAAHQLKPAQAATTVPAYDHVFVIVMENHSYGEIIGSSTAPYINSLLPSGALATSYLAVAHPSLPNYLALTGGSTYGITSDCTTCWVSASNLADGLENAGSTWKAYEESMPTACFVGDSYPYAQKHDPFIYFNDVRTNTARCQAHVVPFTQMATDLKSAAATPNYAFITPNMCNDMHDCTVGTGDTWLSQQVPAILNSPAFKTQRSLLAITWDEDDSSAGNRVPLILMGTGVVAGLSTSVSYNHYSLLHTIEAARGLGTLTSNDAGAALMTDVFVSVTPSPSPTPVSGNGPFNASSSLQYRLQGSNGSAWSDIDGSRLALSLTASANEVVVLSANADLWTANAGFNQDLGIFASVNGGADQLVAWKESGGFAGTYSPNAAFVQGAFSLASGSSYVFKLKWKTNKNAPGASIYAGAGPIGGQYSPTRLTVQLLPSASLVSAASGLQYWLSGSDGSAWSEVDPSRLELSVAPTSNEVAVLGANADLWTATAGFNQDLGIFVSVNGGADQLVAWKESGGFAGTFSPNAAFAQAVYSLASGSSYVFKLKWKSNRPAGAATIYAGAGPLGGQYSPTRLSALLVTPTSDSVSAATAPQYWLGSSDGSSWVEVDPEHLELSLSPSSAMTAVLGANVDLWTAEAGYNQDIGIFVSVNGGADQLVAWKESGGFAGTFSPNAAFVQGFYSLSAGSTYVFKLKWKSNRPAGGATIYAGAGPIAGLYSPTRLSAQLI